ncbi:MAG: hypothetical protein ABI658_18680 [Acidimicrobiales bacterium]
MNTATKLVSFGVVLGGVFVSSLAAGSIAGPIDVGASSHNETMSGSAHETETARQGVSIAAAGFRFEPLTSQIAADGATAYRFRIVDDGDNPVRHFEVNHERELHLIVVSRNLIDYAHVHPVRDDFGVWSVELPPLPAGSYRVLADFRASGADAVTLGADLVVSGTPRSVLLPDPASIARVGGYEITISGLATVGASDLSFDVRRDGEHVATEPYLGAAGHLVGIRSGDMAYLHVHPTDEHQGANDAIRFTAEFPTAGVYRLFMDFSHEGVVRTAAFTVAVEPTTAPPTSHVATGGH